MKKNRIRYPSTGDIHMRLLDTLVLIKGRPAHVIDVLSETEIKVTILHSGDITVCNPNSDEVDLRSPRLGWTVDTPLVYVMRQAARSQKQGLVPRRLLCFDPSRNEAYVGLPRGRYSAYETLAGTIEGEYSKLTSRRKGFALSRDWALFTVATGWMAVLYKTQSVGLYHRKSNRFVLHSRFLNKITKTGLEDIVFDSGLTLNLTEIKE